MAPPQASASVRRTVYAPGLARAGTGRTALRVPVASVPVRACFTTPRPRRSAIRSDEGPVSTTETFTRRGRFRTFATKPP
jgi:hypothetical protein